MLTKEMQGGTAIHAGPPAPPQPKSCDMYTNNLIFPTRNVYRQNNVKFNDF